MIIAIAKQYETNSHRWPLFRKNFIKYSHFKKDKTYKHKGYGHLYPYR